MTYVPNIKSVSGEDIQDIFDTACKIAVMSGWNKGYSVTPEAHKNIMILANKVKLKISDADNQKFILNQFILNRSAHEKKLMSKHKFIKKKHFYGAKFEQEIAKIEEIAPIDAYTVGLVDELISCLHIAFNNMKIVSFSF